MTLIKSKIKKLNIMKKIYTAFDENDNVIKKGTFEELLEMSYFVSKEITINYKKNKGGGGGGNHKQSDNYYFTYEAVSKTGHYYTISPFHYFSLKLIDSTNIFNKKLAGAKIRDFLDFKTLLEYNDMKRKSMQEKTLEEMLFEAFLSKKLIVNFRK